MPDVKFRRHGLRCEARSSRGGSRHADPATDCDRAAPGRTITPLRWSVAARRTGAAGAVPSVRRTRDSRSARRRGRRDVPGHDERRVRRDVVSGVKLRRSATAQPSPPPRSGTASSPSGAGGRRKARERKLASASGSSSPGRSTPRSSRTRCSPSPGTTYRSATSAMIRCALPGARPAQLDECRVERARGRQAGAEV